MKQSTKLLSLLLALLMAFSCMSVIGSAALVKGEVKYDIIDDADLSYEQVADIALDLVDQLLADADIGEIFNVLGLSIDLTSCDTTFYSLRKTSKNFLFSMAKGLLGDVGDLDFSPLEDPNTGDGYQRINGDYRMIAALLNFIGCDTNADILSKAAYGIGTSDGISLGSILGGLLDLGSIQDLLADIPTFLVGMVFDMLVFGSYGYDKDIDDIKEAKSTLKATYPEMDTLDEMLPNVLYNLLTKPQDYEWVGEGDAAEKVWDMDSVIMPGLTISKEDINPLSKSLFQILDVAAQIAIDEIGVPALNNNLKKALMEAVEADLNEIDYETLPAAVKADFDNTEAYVTYFAYDRMMKSGGVWYYTTLETEVVEDPTTGGPALDEEGNEITEKVRKYFKVNMGAANEFASLINWDWEFVTSDVTPGEGQTSLIYDEYKAINGTFVGALNNIIGTVYDVALSDAAKADFVNKIVTSGVDETYEGWITDPTDPGDNANLNTNVLYLTKYILTEFGDKVFGEGSKYASYTMDDVKDMDLIDMIAMIGPEFFEDAMPQIILPKNADGTYAFHDGVQLWEFAALVLRELCTGIAPIVNYDSVIFANGNVTSNKDRLLVEQDADEWFNIILNLGTDVGLVYLQQITNFEDYLHEMFGADFNLDTYLSTGGANADHWQTSLNTAILWAVDYIGGERSTGVLEGITYNAVEAIADPIDRLSFVLNKILPLGFVGDGTYTSDDYDLDLNLVVDGLKTLLTDFDLTVILSLFGRNEASDYNFLGDASLGTAILDLVNDILYLVFGKTILQGVNATTSVSTQSLDNVISKASLKTTVYNILTGLNGRKDAILKNAAPVLAKLIKDWGGEQEFSKPSHDMGDFLVVGDSGSTWKVNSSTDCDDNVSYSIEEGSAITVTVRNDSTGVWRHYRDANGTEHQDQQYKIQVASVEFFNYDGSNSSYVHTIALDTTKVIDFGDYTTFTFKVGSVKAPDGQTGGPTAYSAVPESGVVQKFKIGYKIYLEDGKTQLLNGTTFYDESYIWFGRYAGDEKTHYNTSSDAYSTGAYSPFYVPYDENLPEWLASQNVGYMWRKNVTAGGKEQFQITATSNATVDGITFGSVDVELLNKSSGDEYETTDLRLFDTYTAQFWDKDHTTVWTTYDVKGGVNWSAFQAAVTPEQVNSEAGRSTSWNVHLRAKKDKNDMDIVVTLRYFNAEYRDLLRDLVNSEARAMRDASDYKHYYNANATVEATEALVNVDGTNEAGEFELRETNFGVGANGVTVINCKQAWTNYYNALLPALRAGLQDWNKASIYNFEALYKALRVAVNDLEYCRATGEDGASTLTTDIDALETTLRASQARTTDNYDFTDYKMYRLNKYNDARDDANWYINLRKDAAPASVAEIDEYFDYSWMEEDDFRSLVGAHTVKFGEKAGQTIAANKYQAYLLALLEKYDEEEIEGKAQWLKDRKIELANVQALDLAMAANYLTITEQRLLKRNAGVITTQLADEIASAKNMIGTTNGGRYTANSWKNYEEKLATANTALTSGSQMQVFDAKYNLLVARKNLVEVANAGDYAELNALIGYAQFALANANLYENSNKEFGQVLAELGMDKITNVDGYEIELFPGSALLVLDRDYSADDQEKIDDAAEALKEALARLKFKGLSVFEKFNDNKVVGSEVLVEADEINKIEEVSSLVSHIAANQNEDAVKTLFAVQATNANVSDIVVTNDRNYSASYEGAEALEGFAGTNSTVTFYTTYSTADGNVKLPVATVKIVVDADINGDGAVDVLDAAYGALIAAEKGELEGCYLLAGDLSGGDRIVDASDYSAIVNKVVA